jgi:phosphatidylserine decarboxylase
LSRLAGHLARSSTGWWKRAAIRTFARVYDVDLNEAEAVALEEFATFNDFFTRALKPGTRPLASNPRALVSPADGCISQIGRIEDGTLLQAKGHRYSLTQLAGNLGSGFDGGTFATVYLAPKDYHRVHLAFSARLEATLAIPGALFSVNRATEQAVDDLFLKNERLVCRFSTDFGPMLQVFVGAMIVGSIATVWNEEPTPYDTPRITEHDLAFRRGDEIGRFMLGSTVICCFPKGVVSLDPNLEPGSPIRMGQSLGLVSV